MPPEDFPMPETGFVITHFLVVSDQDASREFYRTIFDATVVMEKDPVILKAANSWIILNAGGGPTEDKPDVTLDVPDRKAPVSAFLNIRVADIEDFKTRTEAAGAEWLTEPHDWGREVRGYIRDPDGHLIEVGESRQES